MQSVFMCRRERQEQRDRQTDGCLTVKSIDDPVQCCHCGCQQTEWITPDCRTHIGVVVGLKLASHWTKWRLGITLDYTWLAESQTDKMCCSLA